MRTTPCAAWETRTTGCHRTTTASSRSCTWRSCMGSSTLARPPPLEKVNVLDLFCGAAGGWSLGLHRAAFRTVAACELDEWRRGAYSRNFPGVRLYTDVREL